MQAPGSRLNKKRTILLIVGVILLASLIIARLYLSVWMLNYANNVLAHINGYKGSVESIDIDLYRGAYAINKLNINKVSGNIPAPFISIDRTFLSLQWSALLHGRIVSSITLTHPTINFAVKNDSSQTGEDVDWTQPIKNLMPIDINYVKLNDGAIHYQDFSSTPRVNIFVRHMQGEVTNLRNADHRQEALPSVVQIQGDSIGNGNLKIHGHMNILKKVPDMDLLLSLENVNLPALNDYSEAYASFIFESGTFNIYSQVTEKGGHISGYVKPVATDLNVKIFKNDNPLEVGWSALIAGTLKIFTNLPHDQFATRVDLEGETGNIETDSWSAIGGVFRNAFINAMNKGFEPTQQ